MWKAGLWGLSRVLLPVVIIEKLFDSVGWYLGTVMDGLSFVEVVDWGRVEGLWGLVWLLILEHFGNVDEFFACFSLLSAEPEKCQG